MPTNESSAACGSRIYRDGDLLVAALDGAIFPDRCVVTNQPSATRFRYREKISPALAKDMARYAESAWKGSSLALGTAGGAPIGMLGAAAILASMKTVVLEIGLSQELAARFRRRKSLALCLVFGGLFGAFVLSWAASAAIASLFPALSDESVAIFVMIPVSVTFFLIAMAGLLYFAVAVRQPILIRTTNGRFAWFAGAHPQFLASLEPFHRQPAASVESNPAGRFVANFDQARE